MYFFFPGERKKGVVIEREQTIIGDQFGLKNGLENVSVDLESFSRYVPFHFSFSTYMSPLFFWQIFDERSHYTNTKKTCQTHNHRHR